MTGGDGTPIRVLYIAGLGRSGSTLVGTVLGEAGGLVYAGELRQFWQRNLLENRLCGCGAPFRECSEWSRVVSRAFSSSPPDPGAMIETQKRLRDLDASKRIRQVRHLSDLGDLAGYPEAVLNLYGAVRDVRGASILIDSSKGTDYLRFLTLMGELQIHVLHLVRDPRATAHSWSRKRRHPDPGQELYMRQFKPWQSAGRWNRRNLAAERVAKTASSYKLLRYEDFVDNPRLVAEEVLRWLQQPLDVLPDFPRPDTVVLSGNHGVWGNPSRFSQGAVQIRADDEWRRRMPWPSRLLVSLLTVPRRRRWGYRGF